MQFRLDSKTLLNLAIPMIISNIALPLVGIVDTAIVGHLGSTDLLAGVALGSIIITQIYWICGFLRMTSTGKSAILLGAQDQRGSRLLLQQSLVLSLFLGSVLIALQTPLLHLGLMLGDAETSVANAAREYFNIRVLGAIFALSNLSLIGWMIGQQMHSQVMKLQITTNLLNVLLSYTLAIVLDLGISGVAIATIISEGLVTFFALMIINKKHETVLKKGFTLTGLSELLITNNAMFLRNIILQLSLAFITYSGLRLGAAYGAANAILMQFFVLIALGLDGVAYAVEALVGQAKGRGDQQAILRWISVASFWSAGVAVVYGIVFWFLGDAILLMLTDIPEVVVTATQFLPFIVALPIIAHWCFLYDGVYIGLDRADIMRNTMLMSLLLGLLPVWWLTQSMQNEGLWISFLVFLAFRGASLFLHLRYYAFNPSNINKR